MKLNDDIELLHGDCLELMKDIADKSIDMILCDLPYGTTQNKWDSIIPLEDYMVIKVKKKMIKMNYKEYKSHCLFDLKTTNIDDILDFWNNNYQKGLWTYYDRIIKDNGAILLFGSQPFTTTLNFSNISNYKYEWVWLKNNSTGFQLANKRPLKKHELISVFYKKQPTYNPQGLLPYGKINKRGSMGDNWDEMNNNEYIQQYTNYPTQLLEFPYDKTKLHPTQKPVALLEYLIKTYTNEGDIVLDNCMGSGSTGIGCINTNRKFIGIEKDDTYFEIAKKRHEDRLRGIELENEIHSDTDNSPINN